MSDLIPTPIVDKNGKHTTVRKRATPKNAKYGSPIALALPKPPKPGTPLPKPAPLTFKEGEQYWEQFLVGKTNVTNKESWFHPDNDEIRLIKRIRDQGVIKDEFLWGLLSQMGSRSPGDGYPGYKYNMLLTTERYFNLHPEKEQKNPYEFSLLLHGATHRRSVADRKPVVELTRQEEIDSRVAVMYFLSNRPNATYGTSDEFALADGSKIRGRYLPVAPLADFIRERPEQVDDVIAYIKERGDVYSKPATETMRHYLDTKDDVTTPLQQGWL